MPTNTKPTSKEFICIDKRIGYLTLFIVPAVILIVISGMINSQKMTQNSRASESNVAIIIPTTSPYTNQIIELCKDVVEEVNFRPEIGIEGKSVASGACVGALTEFIRTNGGGWPGPTINPVNGVSGGFLAADKVAAIWVNKGFIYGYGQEAARSAVMESLKTQREKLSPPPKFFR